MTFNRRRQHAFPANLMRLEDFDEIPKEFRTVRKNQKFLVKDSYFDDEDDKDDDEARRKEKNLGICIKSIPSKALSVPNTSF